LTSLSDFFAAISGSKHPKAPRNREMERILGYKFRNPELLHRALTHRSALSQSDKKPNGANEQLELLGDAVLDFIVVEHLCATFPDKSEGELSKLKAMMVSGQALQKVSEQLGIGNHIVMSDNEARNGGRIRGSILEDTFEALVAALYLDGGIDPARKFVRLQVMKQLDELVQAETDFNYKSQLLEYAQARGLSAPVYRVLSENGPDHAKEFKVEVSVNGKTVGVGSGRSKKAAQQQSAKLALGKIQDVQSNPRRS